MRQTQISALSQPGQCKQDLQFLPHRTGSIGKAPGKILDAMSCHPGNKQDRLKQIQWSNLALCVLVCNGPVALASQAWPVLSYNYKSKNKHKRSKYRQHCYKECLAHVQGWAVINRNDVCGVDDVAKSPSRTSAINLHDSKEKDDIREQKLRQIDISCPKLSSSSMPAHYWNPTFPQQKVAQEMNFWPNKPILASDEASSSHSTRFSVSAHMCMYCNKMLEHA